VAGATVTTLTAYLSRHAAMWTSTVVAQFFLYASGPALGVYGAELFATSWRARSAGLVAAASALGGVAGTVSVGALDGWTGALGPAFAVAGVGPLALVVLLVTAYPETAALELEAISGDGQLPEGTGPPGGRRLPPARAN
jgi:hypothetical protein